MINKAYKLLIILFLLFIITMGIIFTSVLVHEFYHVYDMKGANAICFPIGIVINDSIQEGYPLAYTEFDMSKYDNVREYSDVRELSEKYAGLLEYITIILTSLLVGLLVGLNIKKRS